MKKRGLGHSLSEIVESRKSSLNQQQNKTREILSQFQGQLPKDTKEDQRDLRDQKDLEFTHANIATPAKNDLPPPQIATVAEIATHANIATHQAKTIQSTPANIARVREVQGYLKLPNGILDLLCSELDSNEQLLFLHLYRLTRGFNKDSVIISLAKIEQRVKFSERTIQKTLTSLEQKGLVKRIGYKFGGDGTKGMVIWVVEIATPANSATVAKNTIPANSADIKDPKDLKEIIKNILSLNKNGNYKISDLAELVKGVCAKEGIRFDNDTFNEMVRRRG